MRCGLRGDPEAAAEALRCVGWYWLSDDDVDHVLAGLTTGRASRLEGGHGRIFAPADVTGADLVEVAEGLLALPGRNH